MKLSLRPLAGLTVLYVFCAAALTALVYIAVQQNYRQNANDPQIQLAEDAAQSLDHGLAPSSVVPAARVDLGTSLAPFIIVTDDNYRILASSGTLNGRTVLPPTGAFTAALTGRGKDTARTGENRITWQPSSSVREAAVITRYSGGYVVAARSLREVEIREDDLASLCGLAFAGLIIGGLGISIGNFLVFAILRA